MRERISVMRKNLDLVILIGIGLVFLSGWVFLEVADEVVEGEAQRWDELIMHLIGGRGDWDPVGPQWFEDLWRDITALGGVGITVLITVAAVLYFVLGGRWAPAILVAATYAGAGVLTFWLKTLFARPRPETMTDLARVASASFPSGHAMVSIVVYLTLGALLASAESRLRFKLFFVFAALSVAFLVGVSRVYLGVHYPTDILAGWSLGLLWASLCWIIARYHALRSRGLA